VGAEDLAPSYLLVDLALAELMAEAGRGLGQVLDVDSFGYRDSHRSISANNVPEMSDQQTNPPALKATPLPNHWKWGWNAVGAIGTIVLIVIAVLPSLQGVREWLTRGGLLGLGILAVGGGLGVLAAFLVAGPTRGTRMRIAAGIGGLVFLVGLGLYISADYPVKNASPTSQPAQAMIKIASPQTNAIVAGETRVDGIAVGEDKGQEIWLFSSVDNSYWPAAAPANIDDHGRWASQIQVTPNSPSGGLPSSIQIIVVVVATPEASLQIRQFVSKYTNHDIPGMDRLPPGVGIQDSVFVIRQSS